MKPIKSIIFSEILINIEGLIRFTPGRLGRKLRKIYYSRRFKKCGSNIIIDIGVEFVGTENMTFGSNIWIGAYSTLEAFVAPIDPSRIDNRSPQNIVNKGLYISDGVSIGRNNIIAAHNHVVIEKYATTSANVCIYSLSHDYINRKDKTQIVGSNIMASLYLPVAINGAPVRIGKNSWVGLNSSIFGASIADHTVILANSLVTNDIETNKVYKTSLNYVTKQRFEFDEP